MTAYLKWQGMTEAELSLYRGAGAISGLLSTLVFPPVHNKAGDSCAEPFLESIPFSLFRK